MHCFKLDEDVHGDGGDSSPGILISINPILDEVGDGSRSEIRGALEHSVFEKVGKFILVRQP